MNELRLLSFPPTDFLSGTQEPVAADSYRLYQCECFGQIMAWLNDGMRYDLGKQFRRLCQLGEGMTERMLKRAMEPNL